MNQGDELGHSSPRKVIDVIVLTDIRKPPVPDKGKDIQNNEKNNIDFRSSAFKETDVDPLEFQRNEFNYTKDQEIIAELNKRISDLESRVQALENKEVLDEQTPHSKQDQRKRKIRRKNGELTRDRRCTQCGKNYGTDTALKYHIKLKHQTNKQPEKL